MIVMNIIIRVLSILQCTVMIINSLELEIV